MAGSSQLQKGPLVPLGDTQHSTLEVNHSPWLENDGKAAPIVDHGTQDEKIIYYEDVGKQVVDLDLDKQAVIVDASDALPELLRSTEQRKIFRLKQKTFFILLAVVLILILAGSLGGGVVGRIAAYRPSPTASRTPTATRIPYANTGLAALQWTDLNGTLHKRLYYQDNVGKIRESAWNNKTNFTSAWKISTISDIVKPATPLAAVAGYPHTSYNYPLVKNVYYMSIDDKIIERQAQANDPQTWKDDNFRELYTCSNSTFLTAYWNQNIQNASQELVVLFQDENFATDITQARYTSNRTTSNPWVSNNFGFSQPKGSTFAMSLVSGSSGEHLMLYTVDDSKKLQQHEYIISDTDLDPNSVIMTSMFTTGLTVEPRSPLAVVAQDNELPHTNNTPMMLTYKYPQPLTHLILFAGPDRSSLVMIAWDIISGFLDHTFEIAPLQKPNTTFLSLAAMSDTATWDGNVYIMFDSGSGPQIEEWTVPKRAGLPWVTSRNVTVDFQM